MTEPRQAEPFVVDAEVEELERRVASAISANLATGDNVILIGLVTIYSLL
jgi:hypothetical protein